MGWISGVEEFGESEFICTKQAASTYNDSERGRVVLTLSKSM